MKYYLATLLLFCSLEAMTLDETVSKALEYNNALQQSELSVKRSKSIKESKSAQNFGRVDLLASYDHYNNARTLTPLTPMSIVGSPDGAYTIPTTTNMFSVGVVYNVVLFDGFAQKSIYTISDLQYENASIKSRLGREELIYNVRNLYISLLALQEQREAQILYTTSQSRLLERIKEEKRLGSKSKLDLLRAQNSVEASHTQVTSIEANIAIIKATLTVLMGGKAFGDTTPFEIDIERQEELTLDEKTLTSLNRYKVTQINVKASQQKQAQVKSAYYPHVDFNAYYGQNFGPNDTTNTVPPTSTAPSAGETLIQKGDWNHEANWQVGIHAKWNILDFGKTSSLNEEARLSYLLAKLEGDGVKIELRKNMIKAQNNMKLAKAQYHNFLSQYQLLSETEKIEQVRYDNDALSLTDLLETSAKKELMHAQTINAKYSYQQARYYLDYLLEKGEQQ